MESYFLVLEASEEAELSSAVGEVPAPITEGRTPVVMYHPPLDPGSLPAGPVAVEPMEEALPCLFEPPPMLGLLEMGDLGGDPAVKVVAMGDEVCEYGPDWGGEEGIAMGADVLGWVWDARFPEFAAFRAISSRRRMCRSSLSSAVP